MEENDHLKLQNLHLKKSLEREKKIVEQKVRELDEFQA
jgi:regulator of replication initiation timing